jgi:hypothetical protein
VLLIVFGAGAALLLVARSEPSTFALDTDLAEIRAQIKAADAEDAKYSGGAIKALILIRREILQTTEAMLDAKRSSLIRRIGLVYEVDGHRVRPADAKELAQIAGDIDKEKAALSRDAQEASRYSGGLLQTMSLMAAVTDRVTIAQLELAYYVAKYGAALPTVSSVASPKEGSAPGKIVGDKQAF